MVVYLGETTAAYGIGLWLPSLLRNVSGTSNFVIGLLSAIPYLATMVAMVLVATHSDRTGERKWHLAGSAFACAIGLGCAAYSTSTTADVVFLSVTLMAAFLHERAVLGHYHRNAERYLGRGRHRPD